MKRISTFADRLKEYREQKRLTLSELEALSHTPAQTLNRYELGQRVPKVDTAVKIAEELGISPLWLQGYDVPMDREPLSIGYPYHPTHRIPILGRISAGKPLFAEENIEGYTYTERNSGGSYYALRVAGDSMNAARINDGDLLIVRQQDEVDNGQIAIVMVNGHDATVKKYYRNGDTVTLLPQSLNPEHQMQVYDLRRTQVKVLGLVVQNVIKM